MAGVHEGREVGLPDQRPGSQPPGWGEVQRGASRQVSPGATFSNLLCFLRTFGS